MKQENIMNIGFVQSGFSDKIRILRTFPITPKRNRNIEKYRFNPMERLFKKLIRSASDEVDISFSFKSNQMRINIEEYLSWLASTDHDKIAFDKYIISSYRN